MNRPTTMEDYDLLEQAYGDMMHLAGTITGVLNCMSNDAERGHLAFCMAMENEHRTLQQAFTRLCAAWFLSPQILSTGPTFATKRPTSWPSC